MEQKHSPNENWIVKTWVTKNVEWSMAHNYSQFWKYEIAYIPQISGNILNMMNTKLYHVSTFEIV